MFDKCYSKITLLTLFLVPLIAACNSTTARDSTTDTKSIELTTETEQIDFLSQYVNLKSGVLETEYHIVYHDNSGGLAPGPSDWDIQVVMLVDDVAAWVDGKTEVETADFSWAEGLLKEELRPLGQPTYYANGSTVIAVFEPEKIIFLRSTTVP